VTGRVGFAYGQARIQAHYGRLLNASEWSRLDRVVDYGELVQMAQTTALRLWLANLGPDSNAHQIELALRHVFRRHVRQVADWLPRKWRPAVRWFAALEDLPAAGYLKSGAPAPAWMQNDPVYAPLIALPPGERRGAADRSPLAPLMLADVHAAQAWIRHWRRLWPAASRSVTGPLERLAGVVSTDTPGTGETDWLARVFRRQAQRPAAVFAYLCLVRRQANRLRGALLGRRLLERGA